MYKIRVYTSCYNNNNNNNNNNDNNNNKILILVYYLGSFKYYMTIFTLLATDYTKSMIDAQYLAFNSALSHYAQ